MSSKVNSTSNKHNSCVRKCKKSRPKTAKTSFSVGDLTRDTHSMHNSKDIKPSISKTQGSAARKEIYRDGKVVPETEWKNSKYHTKKIRRKTESTQGILYEYCTAKIQYILFPLDFKKNILFVNVISPFSESVKMETTLKKTAILLRYALHTLLEHERTV